MTQVERADQDVRVGSPEVRIVAPADQAAAVDTVVLAFAGDPVSRWSWPHAQQYLATVPRLVSAEPR
jgi:hypothetical protein